MADLSVIQKLQHAEEIDRNLREVFSQSLRKATAEDGVEFGPALRSIERGSDDYVLGLRMGAAVSVDHLIPQLDEIMVGIQRPSNLVETVGALQKLLRELRETQAVLANPEDTPNFPAGPHVTGERGAA